jgi:phenylacetate-CoA ligase
MTTLKIWEDFLLTIKGLLHYNLFLKKSQYWDENRLRKYQFQKIRKLLIETYENVPYYNKFYNDNGFVPERDFNNLNDIAKVPILTKAAAKKFKNELINTKFLNSSFPLRTSGSTGEPFEVLVSTNAWAVEQGVVWRHWIWGGYRFRDEMAIIRSFSPKKGQSLIKYDKIRNFTYYSPFHMNEENMHMYLTVIKYRNTKVLRGYPSSILTLAIHAKKHGITIPTLKFILTASEVLSDVDRGFIEDVFKCKISNHYGLAEVCVMMGDCEKHEGLHNYDEYGYVEFLPTEDSKYCKIVGTNLHNYAMPLIRYDTGDLAELTITPCSCGRNLPTIKNIVGRSDSNIVSQEGFKIPTVNFYTMFEKILSVNRWQIIQRDLNYVEVVVESEKLPDSDYLEIVNGLEQRLPNSIKTKISLNGSFIKINEGKVNAFVSLIK